MMREEITLWLKARCTPHMWKSLWFTLPIFGIVMLPLGSLILQILLRIGLDEAPRLTQLLWLFSIFYGALCGLTILLLVDFAGFEIYITSRIKWLARLAVVSPLLILLALFLIFSNR